MIQLPRIALAALGALALSSCGSSEVETKGPARTSEVLKGTISDDMIRYEQVTSEPPPAEIEVEDEGVDGTSTGSRSGPGDGNADTSTPDTAPEGPATNDEAPESGE